ncbi:hypothetical protein [Streptomyces sp. NPDC051684]|uniref:hypothetical protein n=1 Tax=Streptomyces sp. NPDC051684 TaxID=3365670 RepID=UPI003787CE40
MPKPIPVNRRSLIAAWAVLCLGGLAATAALNASPTRERQTEPRPERQSAHADCDARIAKLDKWMAVREQEDKESGDATLSAVQVDPEDVCHDAVAEHLDARR